MSGGALVSIGVSVISYLLRQLPVPQMVQRIRAAGYTNVELHFGHPDGAADYRIGGEGEARRTGARLRAAGVVPEAYCVGGIQPQNVENAERAFAFARGLGVDVITGVAHPNVLARLDALCDTYGMRYAIENHHGNVFERAETMLEALRECSPRLGVNFDSGHFFAAGLDPVAQARMLAGRIYHVHLKDSDQERAVGEGAIRMVELLAALVAGGFDGMLSVEQGETRTPLDAAVLDGILRRSFAFTLRMLDGLPA